MFGEVVKIDEVVTILLSTAIPLLITIIVGWASNRSDKTKRKLMIEDAKQRIEVVNAYVASQKLVIEDEATLRLMKKKAAHELFDIKAFLDNNLHSLEKTSEKSENYWFRFFLLYPMRTRLASFFRVCFFLMLFVSALINALVVPVIFTPEGVDEFSFWYNLIAYFLIVFLPTVFIALLLRWLAVKFDKPIDSLAKTT